MEKGYVYTLNPIVGFFFRIELEISEPTDVVNDGDRSIPLYTEHCEKL